MECKHQENEAQMHVYYYYLLFTISCVVKVVDAAVALPFEVVCLWRTDVFQSDLRCCGLASYCLKTFPRWA